MRRLLRRIFGLDLRTGSDIVTDSLAQFQTIVGDLNTGIQLLDTDIEANQERVARIKAENRELGDKKAQAITFRKGLENLLNGTV